MAEYVKIRIQADADTSGIEKTTGQLRGLASEAKAASGALASISQGFGMGLGGAALTQLSQIPGVIIEAARRGVAFNASLNDSEVAIANVLRQFKGLNAEAAKNEAAAAMQKIVELEPQTAGTLQGLVGGFLATLSASQSAGISVQQNIDLVGKFANALSNAAIPAEQLAQEMRSIVTGNIGADSTLARTLAITNEDVSRAREAGQLYEFLTQKLGVLGEAGDTFSVSTSTLKSNLDKLLGTVTKPFFEELKAGIDAVNAAFADPQTVKDIKTFELLIRDALNAAKDLWTVTSGLRSVAGFALGALAPNAAAIVRSIGAGFDAYQAANSDRLNARSAPLAVEPAASEAAGRALGTNAVEAEKARKAYASLREEIARVNAEVTQSAERFVSSGLTPEARLQADVDRLQTLRSELARLTNLPAGSDAAAFATVGEDFASPEILSRTRELLDLNTRINEQAQAISKAAAESLQHESKRAADAAAFMADLEAQRKIEVARLAGNDALVDNLEKQRNLASQLAKIQDADLTPGEKERASDLARQTSELQTQVALKQKLEALQNAEAQLRVEQAKAGGNRRAVDRAETERVRTERFNALRKDGVAEAEARRLADAFATADARQRLREAGRFGGVADMADPSRNIGAIAVPDLFRRNTPRIGELFGPPAPAPVAGTPSAPSAKEQLDAAARQLETAGDAVEGAAAKIDTAAQDLSAAAGQLGNAADNLGNSVSELSARVGRLESYLGQ